jgi:hypothetical protein
MKPRLYIETTIPSYLVARTSRDLRLAADQETTLAWWEKYRQNSSGFGGRASDGPAADLELQAPS